jgi:hypothetical protein
MLVGIPKFLQDKEIDLRLYFSNTEEKISLKGVVKNSDFLEGRKDIAIVNIEFCADEIPMTYKFHINSYIMSYQKKLIEKQLQNKVRTAQAEVVANQKAMEMKEKREAAAKQQVSQNTTANGNAQ